MTEETEADRLADDQREAELRARMRARTMYEGRYEIPDEFLARRLDHVRVLLSGAEKDRDLAREEIERRTHDLKKAREWRSKLLAGRDAEIARLNGEIAKLQHEAKWNGDVATDMQQRAIAAQEEIARLTAPPNADASEPNDEIAMRVTAEVAALANQGKAGLAWPIVAHALAAAAKAVTPTAPPSADAVELEPAHEPSSIAKKIADAWVRPGIGTAMCEGYHYEAMKEIDEAIERAVTAERAKVTAEIGKKFTQEMAILGGVLLRDPCRDPILRALATVKAEIRALSDITSEGTTR